MSLLDINATFPEIVDYTRRIYAGMVSLLDSAVGNITSAMQHAGLWDDTLLVFTTDKYV